MSHSDAVANKYEEPLSKEITALNANGTGNVLYYVTDHLGSVRVVKDGSGTIRQRFDYYPYGLV